MYKLWSFVCDSQEDRDEWFDALNKIHQNNFNTLDHGSYLDYLNNMNMKSNTGT